MESKIESENYNKAYAVGQYVNALGLSIASMLGEKESTGYYFNSGEKGIKMRIQIADDLHKKAMDAISTLDLPKAPK